MMRTPTYPPCRDPRSFPGVLLDHVPFLSDFPATNFLLFFTWVPPMCAPKLYSLVLTGEFSIRGVVPSVVFSVMLHSLRVITLRFFGALGGAEDHSFYCFRANVSQFFFHCCPPKSLFRHLFLIAPPHEILIPEIYCIICALCITKSKILFFNLRKSFSTPWGCRPPH